MSTWAISSRLDHLYRHRIVAVPATRCIHPSGSLPPLWKGEPHRTRFGSGNRELKRWADLSAVGLVPRRPFPIMPCWFTEAWCSGGPAPAGATVPCPVSPFRHLLPATYYPQPATCVSAADAFGSDVTGCVWTTRVGAFGLLLDDLLQLAQRELAGILR